MRKLIVLSAAFAMFAGAAYADASKVFGPKAVPMSGAEAKSVTGKGVPLQSNVDPNAYQSRSSLGQPLAGGTSMVMGGASSAPRVDGTLPGTAPQTAPSTPTLSSGPITPVIMPVMPMPVPGAPRM